MIQSILKLYVSDFLLLILQHDAIKFEYINSNGEPNLNGFLNKLLPNLAYFRKIRREKTRQILEENYQRVDVERLYQQVNTVIDEVYFSDEELNDLGKNFYFRPSVKKKAAFNEIADSEAVIAMQSTSVYIRNLLNEYARLPEYKREKIVFHEELSHFVDACETGRIVHATVNKKSIRFFAFQYVYDWTYDQGNYLIGYDLTNNIIGAIPLYKIRDSFVVDSRYKPSEELQNILQTYYEEQDYDNYIKYEE